MESTTFRCYYDDGTILLDPKFCPNVNSNGSPLIASELTVIEDVTGQFQMPWLLLIFLLMAATSEER